MRFGYFFTMHNMDGASHADMVDFALEQTIAVEEAGFETIWMGEHHFGGEGFDVHPNPLMTGVHLAAKTSSIRIGLAAVIATEWHPLRLAEDIAALDVLSGGRVECGLGRGITSRELSNLNLLRPDRRVDDVRNWEIFLESLAIMKRAWTEDAFTFEGKYYSFPTPGVADPTQAWYPRDPRWRSESGEYVGMCVVPKPLQQPHPPLWNVVDRPAGFELAADHGMKPITWLRSRRALREAFEIYRVAASRVQGQQLHLGEQCGLLRMCVLADTVAEARRIAEPAIEFTHRDYLAGLRGRDIYAEPGETLSEQELSKSWFDFLIERGLIFVGTPDTVREQIAELESDMRLDQLLLQMWMPKLDREHTRRSIDLFATEVLPTVASAVSRAAAR